MYMPTRTEPLRQQPARIGFERLAGSLALLLCCAAAVDAKQDAADEHSAPIVIAHRGASGYLPEHTLPAAALAHGLGADYIEQDVVLSRDGAPVVLHDVTLETVTDVEATFSDRCRDDGRFYAVDFTLDELRTLHVHERTGGDGRAAFPHRFPAAGAQLRIATLEEHLALIRGLNTSTGRDVGVYVEIKRPAWHRQQGVDPSPVVLETLARHGYTQASDRAFVQCFDPAETRRLREQLDCQLQLVQLIGSVSERVAGDDSPTMCSAEGLATIAEFAEGIGPAMQLAYGPLDGSAPPAPTGLIAAAHAAGLVVHPHTFRADALPPAYANRGYGALVRDFAAAGIDGGFTDFVDATRSALHARPVAAPAAGASAVMP